MQLIKAALRHASHIIKRTFFSLCSHHNGLCEAILRNSSYPVSLSLVGQASTEKMVGNFFVVNIQEYEKDNKNSRPLNLVCVFCTLQAYMVDVNM